MGIVIFNVLTAVPVLTKFTNNLMSQSKLAIELEKLLENNFAGDELVEKFLQRVGEDGLTKSENPKSHFCVYFSAYNPAAKQVFIGHHKKSGLWLFNGGHIDEGETIQGALMREIGEEWGLDARDFQIAEPAFLTITEIDNPTKQPCNFHYDLWCFVAVDKNNFSPNENNLLQEFHECGWKNLSETEKVVTEKNTLSAISFIAKKFFCLN